MGLGKAYLKVVQERFGSVKNLGDRSIHRLSEDEIHWIPNDTSNSVAVIIKHLSGNMVSRWSDFLTSDGEKPNRNRDEEFKDDLLSKRELVAIWEKGWHVFFEVLNALGEQNLLKEITIRGESHTVLEAIERQVAHYAYHIGQIVYIGKQLKGRDWESLSIPTGQSEAYTRHMREQHQSN